MFAKDIIVGQSYRVSRSYGRGRAVVTGPGVKDRLDGKFHFPIEFPDAGPKVNERHRNLTIGSRDFVRLWTMEDQQLFEAERQEQAKLDVVETALVAAGYKPDTVRFMPGMRDDRGPKLYLSFRGEEAEAVIKALVESAQLKDEILELETAGPHDED